MFLKSQKEEEILILWQKNDPFTPKSEMKGDTNLRKSVGWRTFKVLAFWSEGKWQAQFLKLVPPLT